MSAYKRQLEGLKQYVCLMPFVFRNFQLADYQNMHPFLGKQLRGIEAAVKCQVMDKQLYITGKLAESTPWKEVAAQNANHLLQKRV